MKNNIQIKDICKFIWDIEQEYDLNDLKYEETYIWRIIRFPFYYKLTQKMGVFNEAHAYAHNKEYLSMFLWTINNFFFKNPLFYNAPYDDVILISSRKVCGIDIYTDKLLSELQANVLLLDSNNRNQIDSKAVSFDCYYNFASFLSKYIIRKDVKLDVLNIISDQIEKKFGIVIELDSFVGKEYVRFKILSKIYSKFFQKTRSNRLFIVGSYFNMPIVKAASEHDVEVIELQHGTVTDYHMGYSFPYDNKPHYFPDTFLFFGQYWADMTYFPKHVARRVIGAPYVKELASSHEQNIKDKNSIVFLSQGVLGKEIFHFAEKVASLLPNHIVTFRLHPSEDVNSYFILRDSTLPNFVISHQEPNIFSLLAISEYQAGVFSTALFEGIVLGCKTILIDMPGIEYMQPLIEMNNIELASGPEEFVSKLDIADVVEDSRYFYADPVESILNII